MWGRIHVESDNRSDQDVQRTLGYCDSSPLVDSCYSWIDTVEVDRVVRMSPVGFLVGLLVRPCLLMKGVS
jgi:hypothetical protein